MNRKDLEIRLREKGSQRFITVKQGRGRIRQEEEIRIGKENFDKLWPIVRDTRVIKKRFRIPYKQITIELDIYQGRHRGLRVAEVEFSSKREADSFEPPQWFGREVTGNRRYANASLACRRKS
jgi:CYTH domain-containing protein